MSDIGNSALDRRQEERRKIHPMSDEAAEMALRFLNETAEEAGQAKAHVTYMEGWVKVVKAQCMRKSVARSVSGQEADAYCDPDYLAALKAQEEAIAKHEKLYWKRLAAEATIESWRTRNANSRGAGRMQ